VAAATTDRPEQVRVRVVVDEEHVTIRGHDLGREQVVDREAVLPDEIPDAATERDAADTDRAGVAEADREAVLSRGDRDLAGREPSARPGGLRCGIDGDGVQRPQVDDDPVVDRGVSGAAVAAATYRERQSRLAGAGDRRRDVVRSRDADDRRGSEVVATGE